MTLPQRWSRTRPNRSFEPQTGGTELEVCLGLAPERVLDDTTAGGVCQGGRGVSSPPVKRIIHRDTDKIHFALFLLGFAPQQRGFGRNGEVRDVNSQVHGGLELENLS